ncbi:putative beta-barrel assembly-enhancing protease [Vibrio sp. MACH09]|uniref:beta-barrel assembly-enhancing protease n=1 Tax=Vibrio sp. MACH09 TaxID=3025122 RepID=UPI002791A05A|nr:M48 family metallopeptidase [Vibrio sp. MACH09]GLO60206.1 putative beta-barrel assembly-enhancing protease [Vibrio sp. MACH09]
MIKKTRSLIALLVTTSLITPTIASASVELPDIGTAAAGTLTIDQEKVYGDAYMRMLRASSPIIHDPVLNEYISNLGHQLVGNANDVKTPFQFFMIQDRMINAFAFFGGYVALHSGLFLHANSESELASVMAHEIAHVTQRHLARSMEAQARRTPATIAALAGSLLLAIAAPEAGIAAMTATTAGSMQSQINYTRSNEKEADRFGIVTLAKSGFDVRAMPQFFGRLADQYRYASTPPAMLLTHPLPQERITDSRARAQQYPPLKLGPSIDYHLAKARVVARHAQIEPEAALDWLERRLKKSSAELKPTYQYGQALVYLDTKQLQKAETLLTALLKQDALNTFYLDALSDLYIYKKQPQQSITLLENALTKKPNNPVLTINYANALIEAEQFKQAASLLQRYTHEHANDINGWQLLADAYGKQGKSAENLAAKGEIFALRGGWNKALQNFTQASQLVELGSLEQARYDARIDQLMIQRDRFLALQ